MAPLAWVLDDLHQSLPVASLALRRCVSEAKSADSSDPQWADTSGLRSLVQQFRQAAGALAVIGQTEAAKILSAAQSAAEYFIVHPDACTEEAAEDINQANVALVQLLQEQVHGQHSSLVRLFSRYCAVTRIFSAAPCNPADLWAYPWRWQTLLGLGAVADEPLSATERSKQFDSALLGCIRDEDPAAAQRMADLCLQLAADRDDPSCNTYWGLAAGFFDALSKQLLTHTIEAKRCMAATRAQLLPLNPDTQRSRERHARELLFFCACAGPAPLAPPGALDAVRQAYALQDEQELDYESDPFVRRDPTQWAALRQQHAELADNWSDFVNGQSNRLPQILEQFAALSELSLQCMPESTDLLQTLSECLHDLRDSGSPPSAALGMEFAIASLSLDAVCEDPNPSRKQMERRCKQLIHRLQTAREGHNPPPLEDWMRQAYNRAATRRSMDGLVHALRAVLQHIEQLLEHYFNGSGKPKALETASERLAQADGIFAMLEMEQAHLAVRHMREQLKALLAGPVPDEVQAAHIQSQWASTLSALGFLTNMLAFQPALAKEMFQFDAANGQLASSLLPHQAEPSGASRASAPSAEQAQVQPGISRDQTPAAIAPEKDDRDDSILATFVEEARGVIAQACAAIATASEPGDVSQLRQEAHAIRRAFHTLKGGARMVGLDAMGESAWAFEELFNAHLAQGADPNPDLLELARQALACLSTWMDAVARGKPAHWQADDFRASADALRLHGLLRPISQSTPPTRPQPAVRDVGDIRISEKLFQVFTAEAADHIAQLRARSAQWNADADARHLPTICDLAHTLQGSAATVGFKGLATLARALEDGAKQLHQGWRGPQPGQQLMDGVHEMERLLHRFREGDLEEPAATVLAVLQLLAMPAQGSGPANETLSATAQAAGTADPGAGTPPAGIPIDTELWQVFQEEARELLPALGLALRTWHADPGSVSAPAPVRRILHTLKGSARLAGAQHLGEMAHAMESALASIPDGEAAQTALSSALEALDAIQSELELQCATMAAAVTAADAAQQASEPRGYPLGSAAPPRAGQSLRVRAQHVDRLLDQSSEVLLVRSRMQARAEHMLAALDVMALNATRLRDQLRELEMESDLQMQSRSSVPHNDAQRLDPLELDRFTRLQEIARMMAESTDDLGSVQKLMRAGLSELDRELALQNRHCRELQHGVLSMRLIAFDDISDRLYAVVRQSAKQVGTRVRLDIAGGALEIDRSVLDRIAPCLEHVLRNAVVHGIEPSPDRVAAGKPDSGTVWITVAQNDREIRIDVRDDGGGLRKDRVRTKAIALGLLAPDAQLSEAQALALLVQPGFSTSEGITELAGRGVGMDVVQSEVHALGGRLRIESEDGKGMCFSMVFPLTTALAHVALFRIGDMTFGVPGNLLEQCAPRQAITGLHGHGDPLSGDAAEEPFWAGDLLEGPDPQAGRDPNRDTIAVFHSAGRTVALQVDQALGNREMIIKNLGPQLESMPGLVAISLLPQGNIVLIYNPIALAAVYGSHARARQERRTQRWQSGSFDARPQSAADSTVLVVDDSITMRRVTERLLTHAGWRVVLASDGLDALEKLETTDAALILTDIEMPRMDGFDLVRQLRSQAGTANTPIIIISSRVGQKHRDIATRLGVQHYLGKPYVEAELLDLVRGYCTPASAAAV